MVEVEEPNGGGPPADGGLPPPPPENMQPPPMVQPNRLWDTFVAERGLEPSSIAGNLHRSTANTSWTDVLAPLSGFLALTNNPNFTPESALWTYGDSLSVHYFLTVSEGKWHIVYGYKRCTPLHGNGGRLAGLRGDCRIILGALVHPPLFHKAQGMNTQSDLFQGVNQVVSDAQNILLALETDDTLQRVDPPEEGTIAMGWPMLPLHPKLACLSYQVHPWPKVLN